jgi:uncharacterized phage protein (TIGR02220 family)
MRIFWREIFPRKNAMNLFVYLLGFEGTKLLVIDVCSNLNIGRSNIYRLVGEINLLLLKHKVPLVISIKDGLVGAKKINPQETQSKPLTEEIISYLNQRANKGYKANTKSTQSHINARIKEGYKFEDFKYVIDIKCQKWMGTPQEDYLRPETLFSTKFQGYLNERPKQQPISKLEKSIDAIQDSVDWGLD